MIDVVIVNWNGGDFIKNCIESINLHGDKVIDKIIVVDNCSKDGSVHYIEQLSKVFLIRMEKNLGFAKACNIGARYSKNKYVLFLNPDVIVYPNTLERVSLFMESKEGLNIAVCGVQQKNINAEISRHSNRCPSLLSFFYMTVGLSKIFPRIGHVMKEWDHDSSRKVDHVIGSFYCIRKSVFDELRGFDERFFMYLEDLDLSCRIKKSGREIMYLSDVCIKHFCGGSSRQVKPHRLFYSLRSRLLYVEKYFGKLGFFLILTGVFTIELLFRLAKALFDFSLVSFKDVLMGYGYLAKWLLRSDKNNLK